MASDNPQHLCLDNSYLTPIPLIEASRYVLGEIDLDPASCAFAQEAIQAKRWFGNGSPYGHDGLAEEWSGKVFLNPPGGKAPKGCDSRSYSTHWFIRLSEQWSAGAVDAAIFIGFNMELLRSGQVEGIRSPMDFPFCVPRKRISFDAVAIIDGIKIRVPKPDPTHGNVIICLSSGPLMLDDFADMFGEFGDVIVP